MVYWEGAIRNGYGAVMRPQMEAREGGKWTTTEPHTRTRHFIPVFFRPRFCDRYGSILIKQNIRMLLNYWLDEFEINIYK